MISLRMVSSVFRLLLVGFFVMAQVFLPATSPAALAASGDTAPAGTGSIGNLVWRDLSDVDGFPDFGEPGIPNIPICLYQDNIPYGSLGVEDVLLGCQNTDASGGYAFGALDPGRYLVQVDESALPAGYGMTSQVSFGNNPLPVILADGEQFLAANFGYALASVTLQKTVSLDGACPGVEQVEVNMGTVVTYCYVVTNTGDTNLKDIVVDDNPHGFVGTASLPPDGLFPGESVTLTLTIAVDPPLTNVGRVTANAVNRKGDDLLGFEDVVDTDTSTVLLPPPEIAIEKRLVEPVSGYAVVSDTVTFEIEVFNTGPTDLVVVPLDDDYFTGCLQYQSAAPPPDSASAVGFGNGNLHWDNIGPIPAGGSVVVTVVFHAFIDSMPWPPFDRADCTPTTNTATVEGAEDENGSTPPPVTDDDDVNVVEPAISIVKTVSLDGTCPGVDSVLAPEGGATVTYCYEVTNTGDTYLSDISVVDDQLGAICDIPLLAPGDSQICQQDATVFVDTINVGTATGTPSDEDGDPLPGVPPVEDEDDAEVDVVRPDIRIDKTVSLDGACPGVNSVQVPPGTTVFYCYTVTNIGETYLVDIAVTDNLLGPICTIPGPLAPGASASCPPEPAAIDQDTINVGTATGTPSDEEGDPLPQPPFEDVTDDDGAVVDVVQPGIELDKTVSLSPACPGVNSLVVPSGTQVYYCYRVTNTGQSYLIDIQVTDDQLGPICTIPGPLAPGASASCPPEPATMPQAPQDVPNIGTATGTPSDDQGNPLPQPPFEDVSDVDDALVRVRDARIVIDKTVSLDGNCPGVDSVLVPPGTTVTYCYRVTNTSDPGVYLSNISVTDDQLGAICTIPGPLAPGASQFCTETATITQDTTNVGTATGNPTDGDGNDLPGYDNPTDDDDADVDVAVPSILLEKTVAAGAGPCPGVNSLVLPGPGPVTYCYVVTNTGQTYLTNILVTDDVYGLICTIALLAPGASQTCSWAANINIPPGTSLPNVGTATGTPSDEQGNPLPQPPFEDVSDDDDAVVTIVLPKGSIGDLVWRDLDVDGYWDVGEPGIPGVLVCLYPDDGDGVLEPAEIAARIACQTTDANGNYLFLNLDAGFYLVDIDSSNFAPGGALEDLNLTSRFTLGPDPMPVSLDQGEDFLNADFGYAHAGIRLVKMASTGCCCGHDGEVPVILPGQTVKYCYTVTNTGDTYLDDIVITDDVLGFICTVPGGLAPGESYTCTIEVPVDADICNVGTVTANPVDEKGDDLPDFPPVTDEDDACVDVVQPDIQIIKTVTTGATCPGLNEITVGPGTQVKYCYEVTNTGDTYLTDVTVTDDQLGFICFLPGVLAPGASTMCSATAVINSETVNVGTATGDPSDQDGDPYPNMPDVSDTDDAIVHICEAGLGDEVWIDYFIADGIRQPEEVLGLPGVPVYVTDASNQLVATAFTDSDGMYQVTGLPPGNYTVTVGSVPGFFLTTPGVRTTSLGCGEFDGTMDFGFANTTAVTLQSLEAQRQGSKTVVTWATSYETDNEGFHVWRALHADGPFVRLTSQLVPSAAPDGGGASYRFEDSAVQAGQQYWYRIQAMPSEEFFGPVGDNPSLLRKRLYLPVLVH